MLKSTKAHNRIDLTGFNFGFLTVLFYYGTFKKRAYWFCECACGKFLAVSGNNLRKRRIKSCGCSSPLFNKPLAVPTKGNNGNLCDFCGIEHTNIEGSGRFCSSTCRYKYASKQGNTPELNKIRAEKTRARNLKNGSLSTEHREKVCIASKNNSKRISGPNSIFEVSKRTMFKILKRLNIRCSNCGWDESSCDIHHINGKKIEDADAHSNLSVLCPNCHRLVHTNKLLKDKLIPLNIFIGERWREYYYG